MAFVFNQIPSGPFGGERQKTGMSGMDADDLEVDQMPAVHDSIRTGSWKYLPGEQQRRLILDKHILAIGLTDDETMLDKIPLHEVDDVQRGDWRLQEFFERIDFDGSGTISKQELEKALGDIGLTAHQSNTFFDEMDKDGNGELTKKEFSALSKQLADHLMNIMKVSTVPEGYNSGRNYIFFWISTESKEGGPPIKRADLKAGGTDESQEAANRARRRKRTTIVIRSIQSLVAGLIAANFGLTALEKQIKPEQGSHDYNAIENADMAFTLIFLAELIFNMTAHLWTPFWSSGWNVFDFIVVGITLVAMLPGQEKNSGMKTLRLMRAFRVLRIFARLASLRMLINALTASIFPVLNAILIVMIVTAIYAVLGVTFFDESDPSHFLTFAQAMFTMFQVATFDDWGEIARNHFNEDGSMDFGSSLFFMTFLLIVSFTLLPVVVAVLLDNFTRATQKEKDKLLLEAAQRKCSTTVLFSIDPLLKKLLGCANQDELTRAIQNIYRRLDADRSGGLSYHELRDGLKKMDFDPPIILSEAEFDMITEGKTLCDDDEELDAQAFDNLLRLELIKFCHRQLSVSVPAVLKDDQHMGILLFAVKLVLDHTGNSTARSGHQKKCLTQSATEIAIETIGCGGKEGKVARDSGDANWPEDGSPERSRSESSVLIEDAIINKGLMIRQDSTSMYASASAASAAREREMLISSDRKTSIREGAADAAAISEGGAELAAGVTVSDVLLKQIVVDVLKEKGRKEQQQQSRILETLTSVNDAIWALNSRVANLEEQNREIISSTTADPVQSEGKKGEKRDDADEITRSLRFQQSRRSRRKSRSSSPLRAPRHRKTNDQERAMPMKSTMLSEYEEPAERMLAATHPGPRLLGGLWSGPAVYKSHDLTQVSSRMGRKDGEGSRQRGQETVAFRHNNDIVFTAEGQEFHHHHSHSSGQNGETEARYDHSDQRHARVGQDIFRRSHLDRAERRQGPWTESSG